MTDEQVTELRNYLTERHDNAQRLIDEAPKGVNPNTKSALSQIVRESNLTLDKLHQIVGW